MLIADGGGGYGGTDWMSKDVRFMWSVIADQDTAPHFEVVEGWRKTADLTLTHRGQVQMFRDNLASVWPPSKSPAAAAYIARLDKLLVDLQATHDAAAANYLAFSTVTLTLSLARHKLKPILDQYEANDQKNLAWQAKKDAPAKSTTSIQTPAQDKPPVTSAQQEQLNNQARVIMYDLSSTIIEGDAALKKPQPYKPGTDSQDPESTGRDGSDSSTGFAVPPVIPAPGSGSGSGGVSTPSHNPISHSPVASPSPTTNVPVSPISPGVGGGSGPVLGGVGTTPVITPPTTGPAPFPSPVPAPPPTPPGLVPGIIGPPGVSTSSSAYAQNGGRLTPGTAMKPGMGAGGVGGRMTMPSGGVIGANPGSGVIGQMPAGSPGSRPATGARVNPVGGVIGQQGGAPGSRGTTSVGRGSSQHGPAMSPSSRTRGRNSDRTEPTHWDPDNPWTTEEGVDPVVLPPEEPGPIDPGPAIGYRR
ncbi:hypothetical protein [Actinoplanes friuliensis]|uniref:hypothetical protein n=1 Tax=Actinoplanes friuliensis TaxID=196914 RepID=UPI0004042F67|nr:hypothetical protein [Actinoplanes friuliensis]